MTTVKAFNDMYSQFIDDILSVWSDDLVLHIAKAVVREGPEHYQEFMKEVGPFAQKLMAKDPGFFCEENEFAKKLYLHKHWYEDTCTEQNKSAIWQWLSSLYMIAMTLNMFPPDALSQIEAVAESCAKNMKLSDGPMNESALMSGMNNMLSTMMLGNGPLAGIMNNLTPPQKPHSKKKGNKKSR
jgi:hypothetical protein